MQDQSYPNATQAKVDYDDNLNIFEVFDREKEQYIQRWATLFHRRCEKKLLGMVASSQHSGSGMSFNSNRASGVPSSNSFFFYQSNASPEKSDKNAKLPSPIAAKTKSLLTNTNRDQHSDGQEFI